MDLDMAEAMDFYREAGNEQKARIFGEAVGVGPEAAKRIFLYVATDGCALLLREVIEAMDQNTFELFLNYHFTTCEREDLAGMTSHAIDVFRLPLH